MSVREIAEAHDQARRGIVAAVVTAVRDLWRHVTGANLDQSWAAVRPQVVTTVAGGQLAAARAAVRYVPEILAEQRTPPRPAGRVYASAFAGIASDGRPLDTLLDRSIIATKLAIGVGAEIDQALATGYATLDMIAHTQVADAGRVADQVAITAEPSVGGYVRMLVGGSCSRCVILAGSWYEWNRGFRRHPNCVPAGTVVSGPATLAATRRWYEGELVIVTTASGEELPITGNHPVLTDRGWIPAHLIQEGDHVVRSTRGQGATALTVPDEDQVPTLVEDLWCPDSVVALRQMPTATEDFHGDGGHGEVDVVLADRFLRYGPQSALDQLAKQEQFAGRITQSALFAQLGPLGQQLVRLTGATYSGVGSGGLSKALFGGLATRPHLSGCGHASDFDASGHQTTPDNVARYAVTSAEAVLALASSVRRREGVNRQGMFSSRWDAPAGPLAMENRVAYASRGQDLLFRLSGQVEPDRVVEVRRVGWSGHVFNLTSVEGWYSANRLIVSNCDCIHVPAAEDDPDDVRTDPAEYFRSLSKADQDRLFTKSGADAIRDGADIGQVVNARRGMTTAGGRLITREGATRRGFAGKRLGAPSGGRAERLMPESIYKLADGNRETALRLLREHGYIL